jgi:hypothetical protein
MFSLLVIALILPTKSFFGRRKGQETTGGLASDRR